MKPEFNEKFIAQLIAELMDAQEQANATLALAIGDVIGHAPLAAALEQRLRTAEAAASHPIRSRLISTAVQALRANAKR